MYSEHEDFLSHKAEVDAVVAIFERLGFPLRQDMCLLDVGGGQGMHTGFLSVHVRAVVCTDIVDYSSLYAGEFLKLLDEKHRRNAVPFRLDRVGFHTSDAMNLIYRDELFDCVVSINAFEHIPDPAKALREIIRVTRSGGCIYVAADPVWTADTGSHFFHRVSEPWAHLLHDDESFAARMAANGAGPEEIDEYRRAMNRWRPGAFQSMQREIEASGVVRLLHQDAWSGLIQESHRAHPNFRAAKVRGFSESELTLRGLRWVFQKC